MEHVISFSSSFRLFSASSIPLAMLTLFVYRERVRDKHIRAEKHTTSAHTRATGNTANQGVTLMIFMIGGAMLTTKEYLAASGRTSSVDDPEREALMRLLHDMFVCVFSY